MEGFKRIEMVDLKSQYLKIKNEIDLSLIETIESSQFIGGSEVESFKNSLQKYLGVKHVITCANGTDALQIALMALELKPGDEVIVPAFNYISSAEVICLLGLTPIVADVDLNNFNITLDNIEKVISSKTKAIIPVHLFGQSSPMEEIIEISKKYNLYVIEDNAQALGANFYFKDRTSKKTGTIGDIGCTSFFPTKNLGCFGDGGAIFTNNSELAERIEMISKHGQSKKYYHKIIGCNSRLDSIQATILNIKLKNLNTYNLNRAKAADFYSKELIEIQGLKIPKIKEYSSHVFHQYTLRVKNNKRDQLKDYLEKQNIPSMVYYPIPLHKQEAFSKYFKKVIQLNNTELLCNEVLSLPMHSELETSTQEYIIRKIKTFFNA